MGGVHRNNDEEREVRVSAVLERLRASKSRKWQKPIRLVSLQTVARTIKDRKKR
jgi:hypothetical protein